MAVEDVTYLAISDLLLEQLPELESAYREEFDGWGDEKPGPHVVYGVILNPYIDEVLKTGSDDNLRRIFSLVERLSLSSDRNVRDVVSATICEFLAFDEISLRRTQPFMGDATRKRCDEVVNWRPK